jgi:ABC-type polysaccharide/polyol phosphate export permease
MGPSHPPPSPVWGPRTVLSFAALRQGPLDVVRSARLWRIWVRLGLQDVRLRFRRSVLGVSWIFLNLAVMILALGYVYGHLLGQDLREFIPFLTVGIVVWGYLTAAIVEGAHAFVGSEGYIKQISLPIYVYVFRSFVCITVNSAISLAAFFPVALIYGVPFRPGALWVLPGLLILMAAALLWITIMAHLHTRFRDAAQIGSILMQVGFYVTPVLFPAELLRKRGLVAIIDLNPMYHLLEVVRRPLISSAPADPLNYVGSAVVILLLTVAAGQLVRSYGRRIVFFL